MSKKLELTKTVMGHPCNELYLSPRRGGYRNSNLWLKHSVLQQVRKNKLQAKPLDPDVLQILSICAGRCLYCLEFGKLPYNMEQGNNRLICNVHAQQSKPFPLSKAC